MNYPLDLLLEPVPEMAPETDLTNKCRIIDEVLATANLDSKVASMFVGPAVIQYGVTLSVGTKFSQIAGLTRDFGVALGGESMGNIHIEPIKGTSNIGIEVPRKQSRLIRAREILQANEMSQKMNRIPLAVGTDIHNNPVIIDLDKISHLLITGATGTGKSNFINMAIASLLLKFGPDEFKMILIDPKRVEMTPYNDLPHLLTPAVDDMDVVVQVLDQAIHVMTKRLQALEKTGARSFDELNVKSEEKIPRIVIIVDELSDLMMTKKHDIEAQLVLLAQSGHTVGIHLIMSTSRPSVQIITERLKANIPARISFAVSAGVDSRVIIDQLGAETLIGKGDMLIRTSKDAELIRAQGAYIDYEEVNRVTQYIKALKVTNIYLDIDGVILDKYGKQMPNLREFLLPLFDKHKDNIYWLTTHCKDGTTNRVFDHLGDAIEPDLLEQLRTVKPTTWSTLKTEGIDFSQDFLWYDDYIFESEKDVLRAHGAEGKWIKVG